jgi:uncharacterized Zn-finger protein
MSYVLCLALFRLPGVNVDFCLPFIKYLKLIFRSGIIPNEEFVLLDFSGTRGENCENTTIIFFFFRAGENIQEDESHTCVYCTKPFSCSSELVSHLKEIHPRATPYSCSQCTRAFGRKIDLERHFRSHTGEKPFSCSECTKSFAQLGSLQRHVRVHTGGKPFICPYCTKSFAQSGHLQTHVRIHTGEKPFGCLACMKSFARSDKLQQHIKRHHPESVS